ncbi:MAG: DUF624 domain-containing protein [Bacilli bacterium]|nr:DUF624 domain-containing protein [Bacilli bacterium]
MKFEKLYNSRFFTFFEFFYRLVILNFITVLFSILGLVVFSLMPALVALIIIIRSLKGDNEFPVLTTYINAFVKNYRRVLKLSIFYLIIGLVLVFNTYFFYLGYVQNQGVINEVFYYLALFIDLVFILVFTNACFICVYFPNLNNRKIIKYSFILLRAIPRQALLILLMLVGMVVILYINILNIIIIFIFIALFIFISNLLLEKIYLSLVAAGVKSLDAFIYIRRQGENS